MSTFVTKVAKNCLVYGLPGTGKTTAAAMEGVPSSRDTDALIPPDHKMGTPVPPDVIAAMKTALQTEGGLWFTNLPPIVTFVAEKTDWPILYYTLASGSDQVARVAARDGDEIAAKVDGGMWVETSKAMGRALERSYPKTRVIVRELAEGEYLGAYLLDDLAALGIVKPGLAQPKASSNDTEAAPAEAGMGDDETDA